jgi:hypothetical protein
MGTASSRGRSGRHSSHEALGRRQRSEVRMILSGDVNRVGESSTAEVLTVKVLIRADLANTERAGMIPRVLVQDSAVPPGALDSHDAVIQQSRSTV